MFDTITIGGGAKLKEQFLHETTPWRALFYARADVSATSRKWILGEWTWEVSNCAPYQAHGNKTLFKSVHRTTGVVVFFTPTELTTVSASLPRLLYGNNQHHISTQAEVVQALDRMLDVAENIADLKEVRAYWKFRRVDLTRPVDIRFAEFKSLFRYFKHPVSQSEPIPSSNSLHFKGTNRSLFCYDKGLKESKVSDGRTRVELRLFKDALKAEPYSLICGKNLSLSISAAAACFHDALTKFPQRFVLDKDFSRKAKFIARLLLCDVSDKGQPFDVLSYYLDVCYQNKESAARARREIKDALAQMKGVQITELICWDAPWPLEGTPSHAVK